MMTIDELLNLYFEFEDEKGDGKATIEAYMKEHYSEEGNRKLLYKEVIDAFFRKHFLNPPSKEIKAKMKQVYIEYLQVFNDENYWLKI